MPRRNKSSNRTSDSIHAEVAIRTLVRAAVAQVAVARRNSTNTTSTNSPGLFLVVESVRLGRAPATYKSPPALENPCTPPVVEKTPCCC
jgi:hypothetical protein